MEARFGRTGSSNRVVDGAGRILAEKRATARRSRAVVDRWIGEQDVAVR